MCRKGSGKLWLDGFCFFGIYAFETLLSYLNGTNPDFQTMFSDHAVNVFRTDLDAALFDIPRILSECESLSAICSLCQSNSPVTSLIKFLYVIDVDLLMCYDGIRARPLSILNPIWSLASRFKLPVEGPVTSRVLTLSQRKTLMHGLLNK